jgi:hypothetical protein
MRFFKIVSLKEFEELKTRVKNLEMVHILKANKYKSFKERKKKGVKDELS